MHFVVQQVFTFDELSAEAQARAVEYVRERLSGAWWDGVDNEAVAEAMVWELAFALGYPGTENHGTGDFPVIDGLTLDGWDLGRSQSIEVRGTLTPHTAASLPWHDDMEDVVFDSQRYILGHVRWRDDAEVPDDVIESAQRQMDDAILNALHAAWSAGEKEAEYRTSEEAAREWLEADHEFDADGTLLN